MGLTLLDFILACMRFLIISLLVGLCSNSFVQNLIPNAGFEEITGCPGASVFLSQTNNWFRLPNHSGTPDQFYGDCDYNGIINPMAPNQLPYEGVGYGGGFSFYTSYNQGEYLCIELNEPMVKDSTYFIEFFVLPSPRYTNFHDSYGAHFSSSKPIGNGNGLKVQEFEEHVGNLRGELITDTINWTPISGLYVAKGGERFMTLGNFRNAANTNSVAFERGNLINTLSSYYFVDGVGVKLDDGKPFHWEVNEQNLHPILLPDVLDSVVSIDTVGMEREVKVIADFKTKKTTIKIKCWDHLRMDNDTVHIMLDDQYLAVNIPIKKKKKKLKLNLPPGEYTLTIVAVNLGEVPPNTVSVWISDGKNSKVFVLNSDLGVSEALRIIRIN